jgi:hypothetical protein
MAALGEKLRPNAGPLDTDADEKLRSELFSKMGVAPKKKPVEKTIEKAPANSLAPSLADHIVEDTAQSAFDRVKKSKK